MNPIENVKKPLRFRGETALAAIAFTDVESFTPKMAADEQHTLALIQRDFQLMTQICQEFDGQVLKPLGDGLLMYFVSAEKAVSSAIEIQKSLAAAAANLPEKDILKHRIGIHLGDVFFSGNDVMGNGVNMAARLQTLAPAGGVCLSQTVYDVVKNRLSLSAKFLGQKQLKGISDPVSVYQISPPNSRQAGSQKIFISYRAAEPDKTLARDFLQQLKNAGHEAFMAGESIRLGENWPERIEDELKKCDYLLLLLSEQSSCSEMVAEEVRRAKELQENHPDGKPRILPIRVNFPINSPLNYNLYGYLDRIQQREWNSPADTPNLIAEVIGLLAGELTPEKPAETKSPTPKNREDIESRPLPVASPELPEGQVSLNSSFYVERPPIEQRCYEEIARVGSLIRIKAPRQMGKTSLMARILHHSSTNLGYKTLSLSFQLGESKIFSNLDKFLQWFCANVALELDLPIELNKYWNAIFGSKVACKSYFERYLLKSISTPLVLGLDEVDAIFQYPEIASDFFGLLRAWHEEAKNREIWKKLRLLVVHSTEAYVPMDINQSPFNVGLPVELSEFNPGQVLDLAGRYKLNWKAENVEQLMAIVGGHPYLVRLALYNIARGDIALEELLETAATDGGIYGDHLRRHLWILQQRPELAQAAKKVVSAAEPIQLESMQGFKLHSIGIVDLQGNLVMPRCNLYRMYLSDRLSKS